MKTRSRRIPPVSNQIPRLAPAVAMGIETVPFMKIMKTKLTMLKYLLLLGCGFAATAVFGQTLTWVGIPGTQFGTNFGVSTNWATLTSSNNQPLTATVCLFDGFIPGPVVAVSQDGINHASSGNPIGGSFGASGVTIEVSANQISPVNIISPVATSTGMGLNNLQVDAGGAQLIMGDNTANQLVCTFRPSGSSHFWINNSSHPLVIMPSMQIANGGGSSGHVIDFQGTGDFAITNNLRFDNGPTFTHNVQWDSTGTTLWAEGVPNGNGSATNLFNNALGNVIINGGTLVITTPRLLPFTSGTGANTIQNNGTLLKFDETGQSDTIARTISGASPLEIRNGTNTFTGANTYTGNTILSGGELVAGTAENAGNSGPLGVGGNISFTGGTLGFSVNNTFDYSSRFSTAASQAYRIDVGSQNVTLGTGLTSSGGTFTKVGSGTLTLSGANTYSGTTTVSAGKLVVQGTQSGAGNFTVADNAALGVTENGSQITPAVLTVGTSTSATLEFNNVTNTTLAPIAAGTVSIPAGSPIIININGGAFNTIGQSFPLFSWSSGTAPAVSLGLVNGAAGTLSTNANRIVLTISSTPYVWTGTNNNSWDLTTTNWAQSGNPLAFTNGVLALFDDTAAGTTTMNISGVVQPASITVNNNTLLYNITSSPGNIIGGSASLSKSGNGTLMLGGGLNTNTGVTTISGGTVNVSTLANGGVPSDLGAASSSAASLVLSGGTLQYAGIGASINRLFTLGTSGGAIDSSGSAALSLTNQGAVSLNGSGPRTLTLTGTLSDTNLLAASIGNSSGGATALTKSGTGTWVLTGTNTYSGQTTIAGGELIVGTGGANGSLGSGNVINNGSLDFNSSSTLTVGTISGTGSVTNDGVGTVILPGNNNYSGGTTINAGTLQIGNGGNTGSLDPNDPVLDNGLFIFNGTGSFTMGAINGTGNVIIRGSGGLLAAIGGNTYTGWTLIDTNATFHATRGNTGGGLLSSVITNYGTLLLERQDTLPAVFGYSNNIVGTGRVLKENNNQNPGDVVLAGTNSYTGGTLIAGGGIILGDGINPGAGTIVGNVTFTNTFSGNFNARTLRFNRPDDFTFTNRIVSVVTDGTDSTARGQIEQMGPGMVTLTASNSYPGATAIDAGATLQVGNGGTSGTIGSFTVTNNGTFVYNRSDAQTWSNAIVGTGGTFVKFGTGSLTLASTNLNFVGPTVVSNGTLIVTGQIVPGTVALGGGDLSLEGGTLIPGGVGTVVTNFVSGNMYIDSGTIVATINTSVGASNTVFSITNAITFGIGSVNASGGTLKLINAGPALAVGQKFTIFDQPVNNGGSITIVSPGFTVNNNLVGDGSVTVTGVSPAPAITAQVSGGNLNLSWPANWTGGVHVQSQTNSLAKGLGTNWVTIPGTDAANTYSAALSKTNAAVFYRLIAP